MTFLSGLMLGLLASAHCAAMCGGLQAALQQSSVIRSPIQTYIHLCFLNLGRLSIYVVAGVLFASFGKSIITTINIPQLAQMTRLFSGLVLVLIGLQLIFSNKKPFLWVESLGARLWKKANVLLPNSTDSRVFSSYRRGLVWGFLPCGLVYGVLMTTLFSNTPMQAGFTMLCFGLGTLPVMILTGGFYIHLKQLIQHKGVQLVGGLIFIQGGLLVVVAPWLINTDFMLAYPQVMSNMFCITE